METGKILSYLESESGTRPEVIAFNHDGTLLAAVAGYWATHGDQPRSIVRLWDVATGNFRYMEGSFRSLAFAPDDRHLLVGGDNGNLHIIQVDTFDVERKPAVDCLPPPNIGGFNSLERLTFHPDGTKFASLINDSRIRIWDTQNFSRLQTIYGYGWCHSYAQAVYLPEINRIATGTHTDVLHFWDATTGELLETVEFFSYIQHLEDSPDGRKIAINVGATNQIWDAATAEQLHVFEDRCFGSAALEFFPSGKYLGSISACGTFIWDVETGEEVRWIRRCWSDHRLLKFTSDERQIVSIKVDKVDDKEETKTVFWDIETGERVEEIGYVGPVVDVGPDFLQARQVEDTIEIRFLRLNGLLCRIPDKPRTVEFSEIFLQKQFHPSGNVLAVLYEGYYGEPGEYRFYNTRTGKLISTISGIRGLQFAADGDCIFLADDKGILGLYRTSDVLGKSISSGFAVRPLGKKLTTFGRIKQSQLLQNYPNPFNPETWIPYYLGSDSEVAIRIHNSLGRLVRILSLGRKDAGTYLSKPEAAYWDGKNSSGQEVVSGVYYYTMQTEDFASTRKMVVLR
jgi:hypothetical protein